MIEKKISKRKMPEKKRKISKTIIKQKFKIIRNSHLGELEEKVNEFLESKDIEVRGLTFNMSVQPDLEDLAIYIVSIWYLKLFIPKKKIRSKGK